jgi:glycopeptide antibiotics resistance protein
MISNTNLRRLFAAYALILIYGMIIYQRNLDFSWLVTGGWDRLHQMMSETTNLIPFATINRYLSVLDRPSGLGLFLYNVVGNIVILIPFGYLMPLAAKRMKTLVWVALIGLIMIVSIEGLQYISMSGSLDVDDVLLNFIGILVGFWLSPVSPKRWY